MASATRKQSFVLYAFMFLLIFITPSVGWWCTGHMLVAEIAKQSVPTNVWARVERSALFLYNQGGFKNNPTAIEAACWADDLKLSGLETMADWHFIDIPYKPQQTERDALDSNLADHRPLEVGEINPTNLVTTIDSLVKATTSEKATEWGLSFSLMNLIHLVGDIHQPLHTAALYNSHFPEGDMGGNKFLVFYQGKETNLHSFWDSVGELYSVDLKRPLDKPDLEMVVDTAKELIDTFTFDENELADPNVHHWANTSHQIAVDAAYANVTFHDELSDFYIRRARLVGHRQLTLAGLRLGRLLKRIFNQYCNGVDADETVLDIQP